MEDASIRFNLERTILWRNLFRREDDMNPQFESVHSSAHEEPVRGFLHRPTNPVGDGIVLTHGAGSNCDAPLLISLATSFSADGLTVLRCDLPYRQLRPTGPPRNSAEPDQRGLQAAATFLREQIPGRVFLGGHSYGGRQATMLAAARPSLVDALLLLSYPLHPPRRPDELRTEHWPRLRTPALFVHGTKDGFGTIEELRSALKLIPARNELLVIEGGGHELAAKRNLDKVSRMIVETFRAFTSESALLG
jgi:hypothetical protein